MESRKIDLARVCSCKVFKGGTRLTGVRSLPVQRRKFFDRFHRPAMKSEVAPSIYSLFARGQDSGWETPGLSV